MSMKYTVAGERANWKTALLSASFLFLLSPLSAGAQMALPVPPELPPSPPAEPALSFSASPENIVSGASAILSWSSENSAGCVASGDWSGAKAVSGSESVSPVSDSNYLIACFDAFHLVSVEKSVQVSVTSAPDTMAPTKPTNFSGTAISSSQVNLSWGVSTDPEVSGQEVSGVVGYGIERCQGSGCTNFEEIGMLEGVSYSDMSALASTYYRYRVRSVDGAGNFSAFSSVIGKTTKALAKPTGFVASAVSSSRIDLSWAVSEDANVSEYRIERCTGYSCTGFSEIGTAVNTAYSDEGLSANTYYRYRIRASDGRGHFSSYTSTVRKQTPHGE